MKDNVETQGICENCSMSVNGRVNHIELIIPSFKKIHVVLDRGVQKNRLSITKLVSKLIHFKKTKPNAKVKIGYPFMISK